MKFVASTKPIVDGLELGVISSNVTKFYQKSCIIELTIEDSTLRVNTEASAIKSELLFKGKVEGEGVNHVFVDSLLFKDLLKTLDTDVVEFEFKEDGLTVISGKSKFNLPQVVSGDDLELDRPSRSSESTNAFDISKDGWDFVKSYQLYAIAMSFIHPVYTNVWVGESGQVLVGDYDNSIFTMSNQLKLPSSCLLPETIVNLFTILPENAKMTQVGKNYEIAVESDPFVYLCEFTPKYEEDEGVGSYSSDIIISLFDKQDAFISVNTEKILKYLAQADLFSTANDAKISLEVTEDSFNLVNENVNCKIPVDNPFEPFKSLFQISLLRDLISHMDEPDVKIHPFVRGDSVDGIVVYTDKVSAILSGVVE